MNLTRFCQRNQSWLAHSRRGSTVTLILAMALAVASVWRFAINPLLEKAAPGNVIELRHDLDPDLRMTAHVDESDTRKCLLMYLELTGRSIWPNTNGLASRLDVASGGRLSRWKLVTPTPIPDSGISFHADGAVTAAEAKAQLEKALDRANLEMVPMGEHYVRFYIRKTWNISAGGIARE